jgi:uncharacterized protein with PIN domain
MDTPSTTTPLPPPDRSEAYAATFRFYEELNDFLPEEKRKRDVVYTFSGKPSIKDAIEAQGIPHTEVDLITANGVSVGFDYSLKNGDRIAVYPMFEGLDISPIVKLREKPLREPKFVLDVHLGKLARLMRLLGLDTLYRNDYDDAHIASISATQRRAVLTRDRMLLHYRVITHGYWLRSMKAEEQLSEVIRRFDLRGNLSPYSRCLACNGQLEPVAKDKILGRLEPKTSLYYDTFFRCRECGKIYWKGSHFDTLRKTVKKFGS